MSETLNAQDIAKKLQEQPTSLFRDGRYAWRFQRSTR